MRKVKSIDKIPYLAPDVTAKVVPSPTDGWDAISPLAEMDPKRAPILENWVPRPGFVELRGGYLPFANSMNSTAVETLMVYRSATQEKMFAAAGSIITDVSAGSAGIVSVSGLNNSRWQYVVFTPGGGTTVIQCANGEDPLQQYNGTTWSVPSITGLPGGSSVNIIGINVHKRRLWYIMNNSTQVAFLPADATQGPIAGTIDFAAMWDKGGYLVAMCTWTIDGGSGPDDYAAFISSRGQTTLYSGIDPTDATNWQPVGTFAMSPPISRRCTLRVGSDVGIISQDGVLPLSQVLPFDPSADRSVAITARIQNAMATVATQASNNFGWQLIGFPAQNLAFLNVPLTENIQQVQFVMNTLTGAWAKFTGWNANCFEVFNDKLYFGGNSGEINEAFVGSSDFTTTIQADLQCAFNWFDEPGRLKRMTLLQPLLTTGGTVTPSVAVDADFRTSQATAPVSLIVGGALWDAAVWDSAVWAGGEVTYTDWLSVEAVGHALAIRLRVGVNSVSNYAAQGLFDVAQFDTGGFDISLSPNLPTLKINAFNSILEMGGPI